MSELTAIAPQMMAVLGWTLIHFVWQATAVAAALGFALQLIPRGFARTRYIAGCVALALMPIVSAATAWRMAALPEPASPVFERSPADHAAPAATTAPVEPSGRAADLTTNEATTVVSSSTPDIGSHFDPAAAMPWIVGAWLAGVLFCSLRLAGGWWQVQRLLSRGVSVAPSRWEDAKDAIARRLSLATPVRLLISTRVQVPMVVGWLKPALLMPAAVLGGLTPQQVEAVIAHELAHIRRHDYLVNFVQTAVETLFFYHPAVWWVSRIVRTERENCCDDLAVVACGDAVLYARALTALETLRQEPFGFALAATGSPLMARVRRLLGVKPPRTVSSSGWIVALLTALMVSGAGASRWVQGIPTGLGEEHVVASPAVTAEQAEAVPPPPPDAVVPFEVEAQAVGEESETQIRAMAATIDELVRARAESGDAQAIRAESAATAQRLDGLQRTLDTRRSAMRKAVRDMHALAATSRQSRRDEIDEATANELRTMMTAAKQALQEARAALREAQRATREARRDLRSHYEYEFAEPPAPPEAPQPPQPPDPPGAIDLPPPQPAPAAPPAPPAPPATPAPPAPPAPPRAESWSQSRNDSTWNMSSTHDNESLKVQARGRIEFTDDDADVKQLSPGGYLIIEKTTGGVLSRERSRFEAREQNGSITRKYSVNDKTLSDEEGRAWLKTFLPEFVRETGINADRRVSRFLARGGPAAVLADITQTHSGYAKSAYMKELFKQKTLDAATLDKALRQAGREIASDYDESQVLMAASELQPIDSAMPAFVEASRNIDSDYDARNVFTLALGRPSMTAALASQIFKAATPGAGNSGISSDYDLAEVLIATPPALIAQDASGWFGAVSSIQSSYDRRRVISSVIRPGVAPEVADQALKAAAGIESDYDLAEVLVDVVKEGGLSDRTAPSFFAALPHIGSDYDHRRVLQAVAQATVSDGALAQATATTSGMNSDYDRAESLVAISRSKAMGPSTRKALADAVNGIGSEYDRGRVLSALTRAGVLAAR